MVCSRAGSSDVFFIFDCTISYFLYLRFSTLYSSSFGRTDTIVFVKLKKAPSQISLPVSFKPPSNVFEMNEPPPGGLDRVCTVCYSVFTDRFIFRYILKHFFPRKWKLRSVCECIRS